MAGAGRAVVIGMGNEFRSDDAVGLMIARRVADANLSAVEVALGPSDGTQLLDLWAGARMAIIVDCAVAEATPGQVFRFEAEREALPRHIFSTYSTHCIDVAAAIEMGRTLERLPERVIVYGIQGARFEAGAAMSPEVAAAIEPTVQRILEDLMHS